MAEELAAATIGVIALAVLLSALIVLYAPILPAASWARVMSESLACAAPGVVAWLVLGPIMSTSLRLIMMPSLALLGGICCYLVTLVARSAGAPFGRSLAYSAIWAIGVFVPTAIRTFEPFDATSPFGLSPIDHGGALVMSVAVGAGMLAVLFVERKTLIRGPRMLVPIPLGAVALTAVVASWIVWLVGAEFAVDDVVGLILVNGMVSAVAGACGWIAVQWIGHGVISLKSLAGGLVSGLIAVTAGAPLFTPVSAAVAGLIAGAVASVFTVRRGSPLGNLLRFLVNTHLLGGGLGVVSLGVLATGSGFLFTGQTTIFQDQALSVIATASYSFVVSSGCWWLLSKVGRRELIVSAPVLAEK
ncbi:ammonium transporter [Salinibacterium sp. M195]|uniref:ammonium transporter n=1 Tax=Salinibacterium sp. M195 TaxID=2583374 RepID=UPI001C63770F|nr:ammonium transporter [Salinibacterium sp. M195]QYH36080.1 ammonium transporter [Salinibacterium sp. M195]